MFCYKVAMFICKLYKMVSVRTRSAGQFSLLHMFSFLSFHPYGVGSMLYQPQHRIIIVAAAGISKKHMSMMHPL